MMKRVGEDAGQKGGDLGVEATSSSEEDES